MRARDIRRHDRGLEAVAPLLITLALSVAYPAPSRAEQSIALEAPASAMPQTSPISQPASELSPPSASPPVAQQSPPPPEATAPQPPTPLPTAADVDPPTTQLALSASPPTEALAPFGMFTTAEPVVKNVMIALAAASVSAWTIMLVMLGHLVVARRRLVKSNSVLMHATSLSEPDLLPRDSHAMWLINAAIQETRLSAGLDCDGLLDRVQLAMHRVELRIARRMSLGLGGLASIGATAPFVGLFGTVWGIMHSFMSIAASNATNLAVVAPGIGEALLATALGLVAAIPAVVFYNLLSRLVASYRALVGDASSLILRHVSREIARHRLGVTSDGTKSSAQANTSALTSTAPPLERG